MNNFKKIGLSALAGSLVAFSVNAAEMTVTGSAGLSLSSTEDTTASAFGQNDSVIISGSGETDGGLTVSASFELDGDTSMDDRSFSVGSDTLGTFSFHGSGGSSVMGGWDDVTPNAYEEVWDVTDGADGDRVDGISGTNLIRWDSAVYSGVQIAVAYQDAEQTATASTYTDFGISYSPEMVDGLTIGYGQGDVETTTGTVLEDTAMYVKYVYGSVTVGYQENERSATSAANAIDFEAFGISYAVSDNLTIAYNQSESVVGTTGTQEASGISASFTSGGMTIAGMMNDVDNVAYVHTNDTEGYELNLSFAF